MPFAAISFRAWSIVVSAPETPAPEMLTRKARSFAARRGQWHDPPGLAPSQHADRGTLDIVAGLQVLESGHDVSGEIVERRLVPVARRGADTSLVVPQNSHAMADEKTGEGQQVLTIFGARRVNENHGGMRPRSGGTDESARELDVAVGEANIFTPFDVHPPRRPRGRALARPGERGDLARGIALNSIRDSIAPGTAAPGPAKNGRDRWIQRPQFAGSSKATS